MENTIIKTRFTFLLNRKSARCSLSQRVFIRPNNSIKNSRTTSERSRQQTGNTRIILMKLSPAWMDVRGVSHFAKHLLFNAERKVSTPPSLISRADGTSERLRTFTLHLPDVPSASLLRNRRGCRPDERLTIRGGSELRVDNKGFDT